MIGADRVRKSLLIGISILSLLQPVAPAALADTAAPPPTAGKPLVTPGWPKVRKISEGGTVAFYLPQVTDWLHRQADLHALAAVAYVPKKGARTEYGAVEFDARTEVDPDTRQVNLTDFKVDSGNFPGVSREKSQAYLEQLKTGVAQSKTSLVIPLDQILASVQNYQAPRKAAGLKSDPPKIFASDRPAVLVQIDGKPLLSSIAGSPLKYVVNTNWDLFFDPVSKIYYLRDGHSWLKTTDLTLNSWTPAGELPTSLAQLPKTGDNWKEARANIPGFVLTQDQVPTVFVSEKPAELILTEGAPHFVQIPGTQLSWANNTQSDLFKEGDHYYYLTSGRWFKAKDLNGSWKFTNDSLPPDFAKIPTDSPKASVLASVPKTKQAAEALLIAEIPRTATVQRNQMSAPPVVYAGAPQFESIQGTDLKYGTNTNKEVIQANGKYFLCYDAVWFKSFSPTGPWEVADTIPGEIYTIPPSSPVYNVSYVAVLNSTPKTVTFGYTAGYLGTYIGTGAVAFGTGYDYTPYVAKEIAQVPIYYPAPATYGVAARFNPSTGLFSQGMEGYGPYGGFRAGTAYNPATGTYIRGAQFNPSYSSRGIEQTYNPRTGTMTTSRQGINAYAQWDRSAVQNANRWLETGHAAGTAASVAGTQTPSFAKGDIYASFDGNVYRKTGGGWQKYRGNGQWNSISQPGSLTRRDALARVDGNQRMQSFGGNVAGQAAGVHH